MGLKLFYSFVISVLDLFVVNQLGLWIYFQSFLMK